MTNLLSIGIFQFDISWNTIEANQSKIATLIHSLAKVPDILLLPETYTTGFISNPKIYNASKLESQLIWQKHLSKQYNLVIIGSVIWKEHHKYYNRILKTNPTGEVECYDKHHLFRMGSESECFASGNQRKLFTLGEVKIMPLICYDLRFPVWSRNNLNYQLLIYVANWPSARHLAWETLLRARAIENQCYVAGVNRTGTDGNSIFYKGNSRIYGPAGEELYKAAEGEEYAEITISLNALSEYRKSFPVHLDADEFEIKNRD